MITRYSEQRSVCIAFSNGCPRSMVNVAVLSRYFELNGWAAEDQIEHADLVLVAGCGVHSGSEKETLRCLSIADRKRKPDSRFFVVGCIAGISEAVVRERFDAVLLPSTELGQLDDLIGAKIKLCDIVAPNYLEPYIERATRPFDKRTTGFLRWVYAPPTNGHRRTTGVEHAQKVFTVKVAGGCDEQCSYCAIRFADGPLRSKPLDRVLAEFDDGLRQGFEVFHLVAGELGSYGQDIGSDIHALTRSLFEREGPFRLLLKDFHPKRFIEHAEGLTDLFAANVDRISRLQLPLESGSERVLRLMQRDYTAAEFRECLVRLQSVAPDIPLGTHTLVGFPGETEDDFQDTLDFMRAVHFDQVHVYGYDDRPNTEASRMDNKVPEAIIKSRVERLRAELSEHCTFAN
jgi:MiaB/RimO family radical SAM methylthiotransferase